MFLGIFIKVNFTIILNVVVGEYTMEMVRFIMEHLKMIYLMDMERFSMLIKINMWDN
jgi:hypothetical protein